MLQHNNISNIIFCFIEGLKYKSDDKCSFYSKITFDVSVTEIFSTLCVGSTLFIIPEDIRKNINELFYFIEKNEITIVYLPPIIFIILRLLPKIKFEKIKSLIFVGGSSDYETMKYYSDYIPIFVNEYGTTETNYATFCFWNKNKNFNNI
jgi:acyl-coenzyme A synthetase/AMP-(fatty) acid ligase